jgi:hypothetical protein
MMTNPSSKKLPITGAMTGMSPVETPGIVKQRRHNMSDENDSKEGDRYINMKEYEDRFGPVGGGGCHVPCLGGLFGILALVVALVMVIVALI